MQAATKLMSESLFPGCADRAPIYDRENFFAEDFEELRVAGYLLMPVPSELGGWEMKLPETSMSSPGGGDDILSRRRVTCPST